MTINKLELENKDLERKYKKYYNYTKKNLEEKNVGQ